MKTFIILFLFCSACSSEIDKKFQVKLQNQIQKLELLKSDGVSQQNGVDSIKIAAETLLLITGIRAKVFENYTLLYHPDDFHNDSIKWNNWYEQNKYTAKESLFDSIYSKVLVTYKNR
jgi:hypothetical protein